MEREIYTKEKTLMMQSGESFKIKYEILKDITDGRYSYGIAISTFHKCENLNEFVEINDITENFVEMQALFMVLYKYEVTPMTLYDVLDVYLADQDTLLATLN